jgi:hypothetical protein
MTTQQTVSVVITDLDDTLWDWVGIWYAGFSALIDTLVETSGVPRDQWVRPPNNVAQPQHSAPN